MLEEFGHMCEWTIQEAQQHKKLTIYGHWPPKSVCEFRQPRHIAEDVKWAVIRSVGGQKARVVGHVIGNVFYVVFLDKNHVFWKSQK